MKKIGTPINIRLDGATLAAVQKKADKLGKPLRAYLREIIEEKFKKGKR